jgi:dihydroorotase-like cyclic amidohydrolase
MGTVSFRGGTIILEDRLLAGAQVDVDGARITALKTNAEATGGAPGHSIDLEGGYPAPGFVDLSLR